ncbi:MAG: SMC family ATPase, partial [Acidimicrobiia bacterium]
VYTTMRELARTRAAVASERADDARRSLEALDVPDADARESAISHRDTLERLADELPEKEKALATLDEAVEAAKRSQAELDDALGRLAAIEAPPRLEQLETLSVEARSRVVETEEARRHAVEELAAIEDSVAALPTTEQARAWRKTRGRLDELDRLLADDGLDEAKERLVEAESELKESLAAAEAAREATAGARAEHSAHVLADALTAGESCPVCGQTVAEVPTLDQPPMLAEVEDVEAKAEADVSRCRAVAEEARTSLARIEAGRARLLEQRESVIADLEEAPDDLESLESKLRRLDERLKEDREKVEKTEEEAEAAQKELESLADASRQVAKSLTAAQIELARAGLEPHLSEADDVTVQWKELLVWRDQTMERLRNEHDTAVETVASAEVEAGDARREMVDEIRSHGIEPVEPFAVRVATALQTARSVVDEQDEAVERSAVLTTELEEAATKGAVAGALANHLKANGFEQWLMSGALVDLVTGANELLGQLSDGGYSLFSDESGSFSIVDHRNADEMRRVETLSGGETFLVSLALALSLAETLAAKGGSGLDAVILDEGFGTLDHESLDTVASVLEELTGKGLMVGVITHVKELAARAPVQYEVTKGPGGASVERLAT